MRVGRVYRRCTRCGKAMERRCNGCGGQRFSWTYVVDVAAGGARRDQHTKGGFATKSEAVTAMHALQTAVASGTYIEPTHRTVGQYLQEWLTSIQGQVRPSTFVSYELNVRRYITPYLGGLPLQHLARPAVKGLYQRLEEGGRVRGGAASRRRVSTMSTSR